MPDENRTRADAIYELVSQVSHNLAEVDKSTAVHAEKMTQVVEHLRVMNGRIAKNEDRLTTLEAMRAEMRGVYKVIASISAAVGAAAGWLFDHWPKH